MPYCPPELLDDLVEVFADVRTWPDVIEKRPGRFYVGRQPFLHFHLVAGGRRRADIKGRTTWRQLDLPRPVTATGRRALLRALRMGYRAKQTPPRADARATRRSERRAESGSCRPT